MIAAIEAGQELVGMSWIAHHSIEIDYGVKMAGCANPLIYCLAIGFALRIGMIII